MTTMYDDALFRAQCPAFADTTKYPAVLCEMYWEIAMNFCTLDGSPYVTLSGASYMYTVNMITAHLMTVTPTNSQSGAAGSRQGEGFTTSATIGEVTVAKLAPPVKDGWQFWLSQTTYGQALWALLEVRSVGGFGVGGLPERDAFRKVCGVFL